MPQKLRDCAQLAAPPRARCSTSTALLVKTQAASSRPKGHHQKLKRPAARAAPRRHHAGQRRPLQPRARSATGPASSAPAGRCPSAAPPAPSAARTRLRSTARRPRSCPGPARPAPAGTACPASPRRRPPPAARCCPAAAIRARRGRSARRSPPCRAPAEQRQRAADHHAQEGRMKMPRAGSVAKACTRGQHARADQEGAEQAQRERGDRQQHRPGLEGAALLGHRQRVDQRGAASQGMKEAFSTGSQNHQPPQPSS
jgi:hypothetical protein